MLNLQWSCCWRSWCWTQQRWHQSDPLHQRLSTGERDERKQSPDEAWTLGSACNLYDKLPLRVRVGHLWGLSIVQSPSSQFEVSSLPALERVGLFHQISLLQHRLQHTESNTSSQTHRVKHNESKVKSEKYSQTQCVKRTNRVKHTESHTERI